MSESEDDWFEKDVEEIVEAANKHKFEETKRLHTEDILLEANDLDKKFDGMSCQEYGGSYEIPKPKVTKKKQRTDTSNHDASTSSNYVQPLSWKAISELMAKSPLDIFLTVNQEDCGFLNCFQEEIRPKFCSYVVTILAKLCSLPMDEFNRELLAHFVQSSTIQKQILITLNEISSQKNVKAKSILHSTTELEYMQAISNILKAINRLNVTSGHFGGFLELLLNNWTCTGEEFELIKNEIKEVYCNQKKEPHERVAKHICPTLEELKETRLRFLRPNITKGKFESVEHYLEVHKSLLRADFLCPLRDKIAESTVELTETSDDSTSDSVSSDEPKLPIKVQEKVRLLPPSAVDLIASRVHNIFVDVVASYRHHPAELNRALRGTRNFLHKNLLCFTSSSDFSDLIQSVVTDTEHIKKGYIQVEILKMENISSIFDRDFFAVQSEVFFEPYLNVYTALQRLDRSNFPMKDYIVDVKKDSNPPKYLTTNKIQRYKINNYSFDPLDRNTYPPAEALGMNFSQLAAFEYALTNEFALIQGPPGTGKTFIGEKIVMTLLKNVNVKILIICYTNHALDQFLRQGLKTTKNIVRMGLNSKDKELDKYNITQLEKPENIDWRLHSLYYKQKQKYANLLVEFNAIQSDETKLIKVQEEMLKVSRKMNELHQIFEYFTIKDRSVIGMTTTRAARSNILLQLLNIPIVVVEEAGQVLESHIIAALTKQTQHLILIGDHRQLRPSTSVYRLSQMYKMDISLFERMIKNDLNWCCLAMQHRMRPEIADLLRPTIYKKLIDHESVHLYPNVRGVTKNLFFVSHSNMETITGIRSTKSNKSEAAFVVNFANYLIMQGYQAEDIVIITLYTGQLEEIKICMESFPTLKKVRATVIDNFQGEEGRIVLLSLVRSNNEKSIGFLGDSNRICVLLSRAREGLYIIGHYKFLTGNSRTWYTILSKLKKQNSVNEKLPLYCEAHDIVTMITSNKDFAKVQFGGCTEKCNYKFSCGHECNHQCHCGEINHQSACNCIKMIAM